jgi:HK97 family phage prohead protease
MDLSTRAEARNSIESRSRPFDGAELREDSGGKSLTFTGYASVFDAPYEVNDWLGSFNETIAPGAFARSLALGADVPFKLNHEGMTLARTKSGTMQLAEDSKGLHVEARLDPANPQVQALRSAMDRGDIDEMSFAFRVTDDMWSPDYLNRSVTGADIHKGDVSAVNYGANPATAGASLRSAEVRRFANALRDAGGLEPEAREALLKALTDAEATEAQPEIEAKGLLSLHSVRLRMLSL